MIFSERDIERVDTEIENAMMHLNGHLGESHLDPKPIPDFLIRESRDRLVHPLSTAATASDPKGRRTLAFFGVSIVATIIGYVAGNTLSVLGVLATSAPCALP